MSTASDPRPDGSPPTAALMLRIAGRQGPTFSLDAAADNTVGRSPEARIVIADRLASRAHAAVRFDPATREWGIRDLGSRNGTWLDGLQVTSAPLADGSLIRIGGSELVFRRTVTPAAPDMGDSGDRVVRCGPVSQLEGSVLRRSAIGSTDDARRPLLLYEASIRLLASRSVREVIATTLELAAQHCGAAGVGWFRVHDERHLEPVCVVPPGSPLAQLLGESTSRLVAVEGNAVWVARSPAGNGVKANDEVEVACVPMVEGDRVHAALGAVAARGAMRSTDFDFLVALASLAAAACAGHAEPAIVRIDAHGRSPDDQPHDLASLQTVELDVQGGDADGTIALDAAAVAALGLDHVEPPATDGSPLGPRIESFVAETPTLKLDDWQRQLVIEALRRTGGSVPNAAAELGISRMTLHRQLERYGLIKER